MSQIPITTTQDNVTIDLGQIQFDRSITPGAQPAAANLAEGAIAINLADRKIYTKNNTGEVITLGRDYTADIAAAQATAISTSNTYTDTQVAALRGGGLDTSLDTLLKLGNRLQEAEANIQAGADNVAALTKADIGLGNVENFGISDSVTEDNSSQYASSAAVKTAHDRAISAETTAIAYADQVKSDLLGGAPPAALDTLNELATALSDNDSDITAINNTLATKASITQLNDGLALKVDIASISDAIDSESTTNVASSKAVFDALALTAANLAAGLALKVDKASISNLIDSTSETDVASSRAVNDARQAAVDHANSLVVGLAANLDYGVTF